MSVKLPRARLLGILSLTLLSAYFIPSSDSEIVAPRKAGHRSGTSVAPSQSAAMEVLSVRTRDAGLGSDVASGVFAVAKWRVIDAKPIASIPVQVAVPPLAPQAPPLPFRFLGRLVEEGKVTIFLQNKEQSVVVRVGDTIDEQYKVESLDDGILTLRYLPLNQVQTLDVGSQS